MGSQELDKLNNDKKVLQQDGASLCLAVFLDTFLIYGDFYPKKSLFTIIITYEAQTHFIFFQLFLLVEG